ncbi:MAG: hypothetical protein NUV63_08745, partial [Gallionella sp.]|nr:hypothetical protein [Gallionella sp.]
MNLVIPDLSRNPAEINIGAPCAPLDTGLTAVNVGWKKRSVSTNGLPRRIGGYALRALSTLRFLV